MSSHADEALLATLRAVAGAFRELGAPAMIIGGIAVIARGIPRQTVDVDGTVWGEALDRATIEDFAGIAVPVASAEDLIVYKAVAWRDRDRADVERLLVRYGSRVDLDRIRSILGEVAALLEEPARLAEFDAVVRRVAEATGDAPR